MTSVRPLSEFDDEISEFVDSKDDPEEWYVLVGDLVGNYSVHTAEKPDDYEEHENELPPEDRDANEAVDGFYQIGSSGWVDDAFENNCGFVGEYAGGSKLDTRLLNILVVHEDMVSEEVIDKFGGTTDDEGGE